MRLKLRKFRWLTWRHTLKDIVDIQKELEQEHIAGWLLTDYENTNRTAGEFLEMDPDRFVSRRWFYYIPVQGEPVKIVHAIERTVADHLPGRTYIYLGYSEMVSVLKSILPDNGIVAMEYSEECRIPSVSRVDAGMVALIQKCTGSVVSSAALLQKLTARWDSHALAGHRNAAEKLRIITDDVREFLSHALRSAHRVTEWDIRKLMMDCFEKHNLISDSPPICAAGINSADPHYDARKNTSLEIKSDMPVLIDLWAKLPDPGAVYADITWMLYTGNRPPEKFLHVFNVVMAARNAGVDFVRERFAQGIDVTGAEVDRVVRRIISEAGFGKYFLHRTGHSLGVSVHGPGTNIDSLESIDTRALIPDTGFTIEPGIYLPGEFGVRLELDMVILHDGSVEISGQPIQEQLVLIH